MKKYIFEIFVLLVLILNMPCLSANDRTQLGLKDKVKIIRTLEYSNNPDDNTQAPVLESSYLVEFNEQGNKISEKNADSKIEYKYYDNNLLQGSTITSNSGQLISGKELSYYSNTDKLVSEKEFNGTNKLTAIRYYLYKHDDNGGIVLDKVLDYKSDELDTTAIDYETISDKFIKINDLEHLLGKLYENTSGSCVAALKNLDHVKQYIYNEAGKVDSIFDYNAKFEKVGATIYTYFKTGYIIENSFYSNGANGSTIISKYDKKNNKTEELQLNSSGNIYQDISYKYDRSNNLVSQKILKNSNPYQTWKYVVKLDRKGNWATKSIYLNNRLIKIEKREFTYYK